MSTTVASPAPTTPTPTNANPTPGAATPATQPPKPRAVLVQPARASEPQPGEKQVSMFDALPQPIGPWTRATHRVWNSPDVTAKRNYLVLAGVTNGMLLSESMHAALMDKGFGAADIPAALWRFFYWPKPALERLAGMTRRLGDAVEAASFGSSGALSGVNPTTCKQELSRLIELAARAPGDKAKSLAAAYTAHAPEFSKLKELQPATRKELFEHLAQNVADKKLMSPKVKDGATMGLGAVALMFAWNSFATAMDNRRATPTERIMKLFPVATSLLALIPQRPQIGIVSWTLLFTNAVFDAAFWGPQARREERRGFDPIGDMKKKLSKKKRIAAASKQARAKAASRIPVLTPGPKAPDGPPKPATTRP